MINSEYECPNCGREMRLAEYKEGVDGYRLDGRNTTTWRHTRRQRKCLAYSFCLNKRKPLKISLQLLDSYCPDK